VFALRTADEIAGAREAALEDTLAALQAVA
jgi:hypothetical protein